MQLSHETIGSRIDERLSQTECIYPRGVYAPNFGVNAKEEGGCLYRLLYPEAKEETLSAAEHAGYRTAVLLDDELEIFISRQNPLAKKAHLMPSDCQSLTLARYIGQNDLVSRQFVPYFPKTKIRLSNQENALQLIAQNKVVAYYPVKITSVSQYVTDGSILPISIPR